MDFISANAVTISGLILLIAYIFIALEKVPKVTIALIGAGLTLLLGLVNPVSPARRDPPRGRRFSNEIRSAQRAWR